MLLKLTMTASLAYASAVARGTMLLVTSGMVQWKM